MACLTFGKEPSPQPPSSAKIKRRKGENLFWGSTATKSLWIPIPRKKHPCEFMKTVAIVEVHIAVIPVRINSNF
jgi:hypothetical protein